MIIFCRIRDRDLAFYRALFESEKCREGVMKKAGEEVVGFITPHPPAQKTTTTSIADIGINTAHEDQPPAPPVGGDSAAERLLPTEDDFCPAQHLSPEQYHDILAQDEDVVLFDARNMYETAIGRFSCGVTKDHDVARNESPPSTSTDEGSAFVPTNADPSSVEVLGGAKSPRPSNLLDPATRQFSDLPKYLVKNREFLRQKTAGKKIMMYCTGGVRCERASQLLRLVLEKEPPADNKEMVHDPAGIHKREVEAGEAGAGVAGVKPQGIYQLAGGIQGYTDWFASASNTRDDLRPLFLGQNFVFDNRMTAPATNHVLGRCVSCAAPYSCYKYDRDFRCKHCRMRILVCESCQFTASVSEEQNRCESGQAEVKVEGAEVVAKPRKCGQNYMHKAFVCGMCDEDGRGGTGV